jgi:hypothetical protein
MFVVVTLICVWLGYHLNWIRQRGIARHWIDAHRGGLNSALYQSKPMPWSLWMLGEQSQELIEIRTSDLDRVADLERLFPEATIFNLPPDNGR